MPRAANGARRDCPAALVYKLMHQYGYQADEIDLEKGVQFGTEIGTKAADIIVYTDATKLTPKIIVSKKPKRKDGIEQLKSYMNAKGCAGGGVVQRHRQHHPSPPLPGAVRRHAVRYSKA